MFFITSNLAHILFCLLQLFIRAMKCLRCVKNWELFANMPFAFSNFLSTNNNKRIWIYSMALVPFTFLILVYRLTWISVLLLVHFLYTFFYCVNGDGSVNFTMGAVNRYSYYKKLFAKNLLAANVQPFCVVWTSRRCERLSALICIYVGQEHKHNDTD